MYAFCLQDIVELRSEIASLLDSNDCDFVILCVRNYQSRNEFGLEDVEDTEIGSCNMTTLVCDVLSLVIMPQ